MPDNESDTENSENESDIIENNKTCKKNKIKSHKLKGWH